MALIKAGKIDEARAMLQAEKTKAEFEPDTILQAEDGSVICTKRGKTVEMDENGNWKLVE